MVDYMVDSMVDCSVYVVHCTVDYNVYVVHCTINQCVVFSTNYDFSSMKKTSF